MERTDFSHFGKSFQEGLCLLVLEDRPFADQLLEVFDITFLELGYLKLFVAKIISYREKYGVHPTRNIMSTIVRSDLGKENEALQEDLTRSGMSPPPPKRMDKKKTPPRPLETPNTKVKAKKRASLWQPPPAVTTEQDWFANHQRMQRESVRLDDLADEGRTHVEVSESQPPFDDEPDLPTLDFAEGFGKGEGKGRSKETSLQWLLRLIDTVLNKNENPILTKAAFGKMLNNMKRAIKDRKFRTVGDGEKLLMLNEFHSLRRFMQEVQIFLKQPPLKM